MSWFVIRTAPGAQMPQREYAVEPTSLQADGRPRGKGYRIVPSLDVNVSAVERSLSQNGFTHYMPADTKAIRDRRKTGVWSTRRFPLLKGYIFVHEPHNWTKLRGVPGVKGILANVSGEALVANIVDIMILRTIEARRQAEADRSVRQNQSQETAEASRTAAKTLKKAKRQFVTGARVDVLYGSAIGRQATITGWEDDKLQAIADGLESAGCISLSTDMVRLVA